MSTASNSSLSVDFYREIRQAASAYPNWLLACLIIVALADVLITAIGIQKPNITESNPLVAAVLPILGEAVLPLSYIPVFALLLWLPEKLPVDRTMAAYIIGLPALNVGIYAVISNFKIIFL